MKAEGLAGHVGAETGFSVFNTNFVVEVDLEMESILNSIAESPA